MANEIGFTDSGIDLKLSLINVTTVLISYHLYAHDLFPLVLPLILFFRYIAAAGRRTALIWDSFYGLLVVLLLPFVPRYLIQSSSFGWVAAAVLLLSTIINVEILNRAGSRA